jgi:hypothetical protein
LVWGFFLGEEIFEATQDDFGEDLIGGIKKLDSCIERKMKD